VEDPKSVSQDEDPPLRRATYDEKDHTPADGLWRSKFHQPTDGNPPLRQMDPQPPEPDEQNKPPRADSRPGFPPPDNDYYQP